MLLTPAQLAGSDLSTSKSNGTAPAPTTALWCAKSVERCIKVVAADACTLTLTSKKQRVGASCNGSILVLPKGCWHHTPSIWMLQNPDVCTSWPQANMPQCPCCCLLCSWLAAKPQQGNKQPQSASYIDSTLVVLRAPCASSPHAPAAATAKLPGPTST